MAEPLIAVSNAEAIGADKAYDSAAIRELIEGRSARPIIPSRQTNHTPNPHYDRDIFRARHVIENLFAKIKHFRCVATRYDKLARNYASVLAIAGIIVWARL
jgi:transposase